MMASGVESIMEEPTTEDALEFIAQVKQVFCGNNRESDEFDQFANALVEFDQQKISLHHLVIKLRSLFQGHEDLLRGFRIFQPGSERGIRISSRRNRPSDFESFRRESTYKFLNLVKDRFPDNSGTYQEFLRAVVKYKPRNSKFNIWPLCVKVVDLFYGHSDLIHQFEGFFGDRGEKLREEVEKNFGFAVDDRVDEIDVARSCLKTSRTSLEEGLGVPRCGLRNFVAVEFEGIKRTGIKRTFGERSQDVLNDLMQDPERNLPVILERVREKEAAVSMDRSVAYKFLGEIRDMHNKRDANKRVKVD